MRCTLQKQKFSAALKHMTGMDSQNSTEVLESNDKNAPAISIVNIETFHKDETKKDKIRRINPLATFNVPHTKHQSKIFKFLVESSSLRQEAKDWSAKFSERLNTQSQKHRNQYSQRARDQLKILKKIEGSKHEKLIQMNKKYRSNKNQLEVLKKKNEDNLIENIESLRKREQILACEQDQPLLFDINVAKNKKAKTEQNYLDDVVSLETMQNFNHFKRQEAMLKLKQNIKTKLSRRHMYHALKQKSEAFSKIRIKIRTLSNKQVFGETSYSQNQNESSSNYGFNRYHTKNSRTSKLKGYTLPIFEKIQQLKIESKAAQLTNDRAKFKTQSKNSNLLKTQKLFRIEPKSLSLDKYNIDNPEKLYTTEVNKQQMRQKYKKQTQSRMRTKQKIQTNPNQGFNMFRLLTPWHNDYPQ